MGETRNRNTRSAFKLLTIIVAIIAAFAVGSWAWYQNEEQLTSFQSILKENDSGEKFMYVPASRFTLMLDQTKFPPTQTIVNCRPAGTIGSVSNIPTVPPPLYAVRYETVKPGVCTIKNNDFLVSIIVEEGSRQISTERWHTYRNARFGFEIKYPSDWKVAEFPDDPIAPKFNIYKPVIGRHPPFDHFSDAIQVSIFPHGIPTEGIAGEMRPATIKTDESLREAWDYVLKDGTPWASILTFQNQPPSWSESGFAFIHVPIENLRISCTRGNAEVPISTCDSLSGDQIVREGLVDEELRLVEENIIKSLNFLSE